MIREALNASERFFRDRARAHETVHGLIVSAIGETHADAVHHGNMRDAYQSAAYLTCEIRIMLVEAAYLTNACMVVVGLRKSSRITVRA